MYSKVLNRIATFAPESSSRRTGRSPPERRAVMINKPPLVNRSKKRDTRPLHLCAHRGRLIETEQAVCIMDQQVEVFEKSSPRMPWRWRSAESRFSSS